MSNQQKLAKLKKQYRAEFETATFVVKNHLFIKSTDKLYPYAIEWVILNMMDIQKDVLTKKETEIFNKDVKNKNKDGVVHKKIKTQIEALKKKSLAFDGKQEISSSKLDQPISSRPLPSPTSTSTVKEVEPKVTLESNIQRVEKGGSVTLTWTSKNATKIKRTNIPGVTTKTPVNGFIQVEDIRRRRDFYIIVESASGQTQEAKVQTLVETQEYKKQKETEEPKEKDSSTQPRAVSSTRLISPSTKKESTEEKEKIIPQENSLNDNILLSIDKTLSGILKLLTTQLKLNQNIFDRERKESEKNLRLSKEERMEESGGIPGGELIKSGAEKMLSPFKAIIDKIVNFLYFTLLGRVFTEIMDWMNDPQNKDKVDAMGRFLKDFWPVIAAAALYFLTPLGGFINGTISLLRGFISLSTKLIPKMLGLAKTIVSSPLGKAALIFLGVKSLADLANIVTGQEEAAKIITERGTDVQRGKALDIKGVDTMGEKYKTPGEMVPATPYGLLQGISTGGPVFSGQVTNNDGKEVSGAGKDTRAFSIMGGGIAVLQPGETVLQPGARENIIKERGFDVLAYNRGPNANNPQNLNSNNITLMNTGGVVGGAAPKISVPDYHSLLAITALESDEPQGRADVAQSIYNRLHAADKYGVNFLQKSTTLKDLINASRQYEPTFDNKKDWQNIGDSLESAAMAVMNSSKGRRYNWTLEDAISQIKETEKAIKDPALQKNSQEFVKGLPSFRGTSEHSAIRKDLGDVLRNNKSNFFTLEDLEKNYPDYAKERALLAAPIPDMLLPKKKVELPTQQKQNPLQQVKNVLGGVKSNVQQMISPVLQQKQNILQPVKNVLGGIKSNVQNLIPFMQKKKYGGLIESFSGDNLPYSQDNILMRAEKGEYVVPKIATEKIGIKVLDKISSLDPNFKIKNSNINLDSPRPLSRASYGAAPITLPPITQGMEQVGSSSGSGTPIPVFSATPQNGMDVRSALADIYGIVG
jgi:hypothetical protein